MTESKNSTTPNFNIKALPIISLTITNQNKVKFSINQDTLNLIKYDKNIRLISIGGTCSKSLSLLIDTLPFVLKYSNDYRGDLPDYFDEVKENEIAHIILEDISYDSNDTLFIVKIECLNPIQINISKNLQDLINRAIDKLYALFFLISDSFILTLNSSKDSEYENYQIIKKMINIVKFIEKKRQSINILDEINIENLFIIMMNSQKENYKNKNDSESNLKIQDLLNHLNKSKNLEDWIFQISKIPSDFINDKKSIYIKDSDYEKDIKNAFVKIENSPVINNQKYNFHLDRLNLYIKILNEEHEDIFGDIIKLESHINKIEININEKLKILEKYNSILNPFNYMLYRHEITEVVIQDYIRTQIKREEVLRKVRNVLISNQDNKNEPLNEIISEEEGESISIQIKKATDEDATAIRKGGESIDIIESLDKLKAKGINETIKAADDLTTFLNKNIKNIKNVIKEDGSTGKVMTLDNGDEYLVYKNQEGKVDTVDSLGMSDEWKVMEKGEENIGKDIKVKDVIKENIGKDIKVNDVIKENTGKDIKVNDVMKDYESSKIEGKTIANVDEEISLQGNLLANEFGLSAAASGSAVVGAILANWLLGQYENVSWSHIFKRDLVVTGGLSIAVTGITLKLPWVGLALAGSLFGIETFKTYSNEAIDNSTKSQILAKSSSQIAAVLASGAGFSYLGGTIGSAIPVFGTILGSLAGIIVGSLFGGLSGTLISYKINNVWKILKPEDALEIFNKNINTDGSWTNTEQICNDLKLKYYYVISKLHPDLNKLILPESTKEIIWTNFIFLNILTFIATYKPELQESCRILFEKNYKFLKNEENYEKIKFYRYLDNLQDILENWITLLT